MHVTVAAILLRRRIQIVADHRGALGLRRRILPAQGRGHIVAFLKYPPLELHRLIVQSLGGQDERR